MGWFEGFESRSFALKESTAFARFGGNRGKPALLLQVSRVGDEDTLEIAGAVKDYLERKRAALPEGMAIATDTVAADAAARGLKGPKIGEAVHAARVGAVAALG